MPLRTQIIRNGENYVPPEGWEMFHVIALGFAAALDSRKGLLYDLLTEDHPKYKRRRAFLLTDDAVVGYALLGYAFLTGTPFNDGPYKLRRHIINRRPYRFMSQDGAVRLELRCGDVLHAWRD